MTVFLVHVTLVYVVALANLSGFAAAVWPQPAHYQYGSQVLWLSGDVKAIYNTAKTGGDPAAPR